MCIYTHIYTHFHKYTYIYVYTFMNTHIYMYIHIPIYMYSDNKTLYIFVMKCNDRNMPDMHARLYSVA